MASRRGTARAYDPPTSMVNGPIAGTPPLAACKSALIGEGQTTAQVAFAEQKPITVPSKLLLFNGGEKGGKITWFVHAYFSQPISGAIVTTVTITKHPNGPFGTLAVAKIPQITGGSGSIVSFNLNIKKSVKVGARRSTRSAPNASAAS